MAAEPANAPARVLLAQAVLGIAPERIADLLAPVEADSELGEKAAALRTLAGLAAQAKQPTALPAAAVRERYLEGATALAKGDFAGALEALVEVVSRNKNYNEGAAKEGCKAIFKLLGMRHPLTDRFLRAFSSALHA
jgi:putative thioredoxin